MVEAVDAPQTLFRAETQLRTFLPSKYISMPNFTKIILMARISIRNEYYEEHVLFVSNQIYY